MAQTAQILPFPQDTFETAWNLLPTTMKKRSDGKTRVKQVWGVHACRVGDQRLLSALRRYVAEDDDRKKYGGPGLQVWLKTERYEHWLEDSTIIPLPERRFPDEPIRQAFLERFGDGRALKWLDSATLDGDTIVAPWAPKAAWISGPFARWAVENGIGGWRIV